MGSLIGNDGALYNTQAAAWKLAAVTKTEKTLFIVDGANVAGLPFRTGSGQRMPRGEI